MTDVEAAVFRETSADIRTAEVPLAHVSVELGHLYMEDLVAADADLGPHFARIAPWVDADRLAAVARVPSRRLRASTCLLIDDYFGAPRPPGPVIADLVTAAADNGLTVDYVARESACAVAGDVALAELVEAAIVVDPPFGTTGSRPPPTQSGWLSNGERTPPAGVPAAMTKDVPWRPPRENGARRHSVFVDVELWDVVDGTRVWSCPMLAAVWQLLRLGVVRVAGRGPFTPVRMEVADLPADWSTLPPVIQLTERPAPFAAYRSFSVFDARFFAVEHAVRTILSQVNIDPAVTAQSVNRGQREGIAVPVAVPDRISYVLTSG
jgi:hypothetical protein